MTDMLLLNAENDGQVLFSSAGDYQTINHETGFEKIPLDLHLLINAKF